MDLLWSGSAWQEAEPLIPIGCTLPSHAPLLCSLPAIRGGYGPQ